MDYQSAISYLRDFEKLGYKFRIENTRDLLDAVGFDFDGTVVHVGGTNGKGSCASALNSILQDSGQTVGLYTSPELIDFTERIRVNNRRIDGHRFAELTEEMKPHIESMDGKPTFFEATTALALKHFMDEGVDAMVLEVGMGGRLDSTNAVSAKVNVITNVELDHTQYLGSTVEKIAREKAGIVSEDSTLVTAAQGSAFNVLEGECTAKNASIVRVGVDTHLSNIESGLRGTSFKLDTRNLSYDLESPLLGGFQAWNLACAAVAAEELGVCEQHIKSGVSKAVWPGRMEVVQKEPLVILDSAHNPAGVRESRRFTTENVPRERLLTVAGFSKDKDYDAMITLLSDSDVFIATEYKGKRSLPVGEILEHVDGEAVKDVGEAVERALSEAGSEDLVLVTGSIFVVGEAIRRWRDRIDMA